MTKNSSLTYIFETSKDKDTFNSSKIFSIELKIYAMSLEWLSGGNLTMATDF